VTARAERVSVVVPAFNAEAHIASALDSILAQTVPPFEVIVVDNGSTDRTAEIAGARGEPVRVVLEDEQGPAATRNRGAREAHGELLAFCDPDDRWHPEKLERQVAFLRERPHLGGVICHVQKLAEDGGAADRWRDEPRMRPIPGYATGPLLVWRETFVALGGLSADLWFGDAADWFLRARDAGVEIALMDDVLAYHRLHGENLTVRRADDCADEFLDVIKASLDRRRAQPS
jgi:glycosyltransferase involved in cell wall biosynthesis